MRRFRVISICVLIVLFVGTLVLWRHSHRATNAILEENVERTQTSTDSSSNLATGIIAPTKADETPAGSNNRLAHMGITPEMTESQKQQKWVEWYVREAAKLVPEQKPFKFYGKVVDENTQAVAGASIHFILSTTSSANGVMDADTSSADDGNFSLTGKTGSSISVYVSKTGFYEIKSLNRIDFDPTGDGSRSYNPVLFHLRKKGVGADLITSRYGVIPTLDVHVPIDGQPIRVDFFNRKAGDKGQMELSAIKPPLDRNSKDRSAKEWSFRLSIPDGGFIEQNDEFPFEAPQDGYQSMFEFQFKPGETNWTDIIHKRYYIAFGQPRKYGRIDFETGMYRGVRLNYTINPGGSRYLEPK